MCAKMVKWYKSRFAIEKSRTKWLHLNAFPIWRHFLFQMNSLDSDGFVYYAQSISFSFSFAFVHSAPSNYTTQTHTHNLHCRIYLTYDSVPIFIRILTCVHSHSIHIYILVHTIAFVCSKFYMQVQRALYNTENIYSVCKCHLLKSQ